MKNEIYSHILKELSEKTVILDFYRWFYVNMFVSNIRYSTVYE